MCLGSTCMVLENVGGVSWRLQGWAIYGDQARLDFLVLIGRL